MKLRLSIGALLYPIAIAIALAFSPAIARAQLSPPYIASGSLSGNQSLGFPNTFGRSATCVFAITPQGGSSFNITGVQLVVFGNPSATPQQGSIWTNALLYDPNGRVIGNSTGTVVTVSNVYYFQCANATSITMTLQASGSWTYTFIAMVAAWPFGAGAAAGTNGSQYGETQLDQIAFTTAISTATTTLLVAGVANKALYLYGCYFQLTGTNSADTVQCEYGQTTTNPCDTNTTAFSAQPFNIAGSAPALESLFGGASQQTVGTGPVPAAVSFGIPANATPYNICIVTAGTTIAGKGIALYAIH